MTPFQIIEILVVAVFCAWQIRFLIKPSLLGLEIRSPMVFAIVIAALGLWAAFAKTNDGKLLVTALTLLPIAIMLGVMEWRFVRFKGGPSARG